MAKKQEEIEVKVESTEPMKYMCHGCTNAAYYSNGVQVGKTIVCPICKMVQVTKLENFIKA